jgi:hypothetical protein
VHYSGVLDRFGDYSDRFGDNPDKGLNCLKVLSVLDRFGDNPDKFRDFQYTFPYITLYFLNICIKMIMFKIEFVVYISVYRLQTTFQWKWSHFLWRMNHTHTLEASFLEGGLFGVVCVS